MKLLTSPTSPFGRKVRILIIEKGLSDRVEETMMSPMDSPPELMAANPLGKVPTLITEDDEVLCDSPLICEYLDALTPAPRLIPEAADERRAVLQRQAWADGILTAAAAATMERRRPDAQQSPMWIDRWTNAILRAVRAFNETSPTAHGELTLDKIALGCALGYLDFRLPDLDWREDALALVTFWRDISRRPSFVSTQPPT